MSLNLGEACAFWGARNLTWNFSCAATILGDCHICQSQEREADV